MQNADNNTEKTRQKQQQRRKKQIYNPPILAQSSKQASKQSSSTNGRIMLKRKKSNIKIKQKINDATESTPTQSATTDRHAASTQPAGPPPGTRS